MDASRQYSKPDITSDLYSWATAGSLISSACDRFAVREAIVDGDTRLTYAQTGQAISRIVQAFRALGLKRGDGVATLSHNRYETILVIAAVKLMGMRYTALRAMGSLDDHAYVLKDAEISLLVADCAGFGKQVRELKDDDSIGHRTVSLGPCDFAEDLLAMMAHYDPEPLVDEAEPDDISMIGYTGGTTGRPKGVVHTQRSFVAFNMLEMLEWEWPDELRFLASSPISHAAISWILPTFLKGGTFVVNKGFSPELFLQTVEQERITMSFVVPTMLYALLDHPRLPEFDTSSLENVLYGAAPMSPPRLVEAIEAFGPIFSQLYGQTEAPTVLAYLPRSEHDPEKPERILSCGYPTRGVTIKLLDGDGREVPVGEIGEICIRGPLVMREYWKQPEMTADVFAQGWLHTGDLAKRDAEGYLYIVGRSKDMIISGGFNIYPKTVEEALALHPDVSQAAVIGLPDPLWGEKVTAVVVLRDGRTVDKASLAAFVKEKRGSEHAPKQIEYVDTLPMTPLGKIDKLALQERFGNAPALSSSENEVAS